MMQHDKCESKKTMKSWQKKDKIMMECTGKFCIQNLLHETN